MFLSALFIFPSICHLFCAIGNIGRIGRLKVYPHGETFAFRSAWRGCLSFLLLLSLCLYIFFHMPQR